MMDNTFDDSTTATGNDYMSRDRYGMYRSGADRGSNAGTGNDGAASMADSGGARSGNAGPGPGLMGADTLLGNDVYNRADEDLGDIKEIMLDMHSGRVAYAVLSFGGFLGMNEKLFAVPWEALQLDTANHRFTLDVERDRLKDAPGFDPDHWPDMADRSWSQGVHSFYGTTDRGRYNDEAGGHASMMGMDDDVGASGGAYDSTQSNDRIPTGRDGGSSVI